jgi:hypothetical protein
VQLLKNVKEHCRAGQAADYNMARTHCLLDQYGYNLLPAFQVQVLKWTGDSGSNPEEASLR